LEQGVGIVLQSLEHIVDGIKAMLDPLQYASLLFQD
jgi:hypothetical protein